ncbi:MAG TPA: histidine phosphatase family protein [Thermoanaerobaculia bacterium]|jgi:probable phosphoglycerate mutase|nr:histidine phosphatase family protein [Thermoanaerobaculia bacterium]
MTTRVYLVRHGATELTDEDRFAGAIDVKLSDDGRDQARRLGLRLQGEPISAAFASPMVRTMDTAALIVASHGLPVTPVDGIREIAHGRWERKTRAEVEAEFPDEYARYETDPFSFAPTDGESGLQVTARALPAFLTLVEQHKDQRILVVSHKATIRLLVSSLIGVDPRKYRDRLDQSPCALNILDFKDVSCPRLTLFNDTSHYAGDVPDVPRNRLSKTWGGRK